MAKTDNDPEFIAALRRQSSAAPMKLNTPPVRTNKSWDEVLGNDLDSGQPSAHNDRGATVADYRSEDDNRRVKGFFVALTDLIAHPWNARVHRTPERIRDIANSMATTRQHHPISVTPVPEHPGKYFVVDGETRWSGAQQLKWKEIWAIEIDVDSDSPLSYYSESFKLTDSTKPISAIDKGLRWSQLISEQGVTAEKIAQELELSKATVSKMLAFSKFSPRVLEFMNENAEKFPYTTASLLAPLADGAEEADDKILALCKKIVDEDFSRRSIEALIKQHKSNARQSRRAAVASRTIKVADQPVGSFRTYENGNVEFKVSGGALPADRLAELADVLHAAVDLLASADADFKSTLVERIRSQASDNG